jgi:hypothetical protein
MWEVFMEGSHTHNYYNTHKKVKLFLNRPCRTYNKKKKKKKREMNRNERRKNGIEERGNKRNH